MDENVRGAITRGLRRRRVDVLTARDDGRAETDDLLILRRATELDRHLYSEDEDLLVIAADCQRRGEGFSGVVYAHQRHLTIGHCIADLELVVGGSSLAEYATRVVFLPL